jgi:hypothetical protein
VKQGVFGEHPREELSDEARDVGVYGFRRGGAARSQGSGELVLVVPVPMQVEPITLQYQRGRVSGRADGGAELERGSPSAGFRDAIQSDLPRTRFEDAPGCAEVQVQMPAPELATDQGEREGQLFIARATEAGEPERQTMVQRV